MPVAWRFPRNEGGALVCCCTGEPPPPTTVECFDCPNQEASASWLATLTITGGGTCSQAQCEALSGQYVLDFIGGPGDCRWEFVGPGGACGLDGIGLTLIDLFPLSANANVSINGNQFAFTFNAQPADCVSQIDFGGQTNSDGTCGTATLVLDPV